MMKKLAYLFLFNLFSISLLTTLSHGQSQLPEDLEKKVDQLFEDWSGSNTPGVSFAIIKGGKLVYEKNCGLADIENKVPINSKTQFNLGQLSAHFTSYALLKLVVEGRLSLDEDVRKYISALIEFNESITIKDLLYGASGIYDYEVLKSICGWNLGAPFSQEDMLELVSRQKNLAFKPGTDYSRSSTNFALIAELIASVSKQSFKEYLEKEVFQVLGMNQTKVLEDPSLLNPTAANAYRGRNGIFVRDYSSNTVLGINNIYSCIEDLIIWENHLANASGKEQQIIQLMSTPIQLANGRSNSTSLGELTLGQLFGHYERGVFSTYLTGSVGGYDASIFKFPKHNFTAIALSNDGSGYNGYLGVISAHHILGNAFTEPETTDFSQLKTKSLTNDHLQQFEGYYWDQEGELSRIIQVKNDTLRYVRHNGYESPLIPLSDNKFQMKVQFDDKIYIIFPKGKEKTMIYQYDGAEPILFEKYIPISYSKEEITEGFGGTYLNKEYNICFTARAEKNNLIFNNVKTGDINYSPILSNLFWGDQWFMQSIEFTTDEHQNINGFYVKNDAIRNLWFKKL